MTTTADAPAAKPGWLYWLVAVVSLVWNGFGALDYTLSHTMRGAWFRMAGMTDAQITYYDAYPSWMHAVWAIGVWGSFLGAVFLLMRSKWAFHAFAVSILGAVGAFAYTRVIPGPSDPVMSLVIIVICAFFIWYSWTMTKRGVLR